MRIAVDVNPSQSCHMGSEVESTTS